MVGLGTMMQDPYGWVLDSSGDPELYYWLGSVWDQGPTIIPGSTNKLFKIVFNKDSSGGHLGTIGLELVSDLETNFPHDSAPTQRSFGNLTFISRNVFLLTQEDCDVDPIYHYNLHRKSKMWANKLAEDGTVTTKIWNRKIIKQNQTDPDVGESNGGFTSSWPGPISGLSFVTPESNDYDTNRVAGSIVALTGCYPYGGPHPGYDSNGVQGNDTGQAHKDMILRLDTVDADINNNYYESDGSWASGAGDNTDNDVSAWKQIANMGEGNNSSGWDHGEGWSTIDSNGSMYYGRAINYWATTDGGAPVNYNNWAPAVGTYRPHSIARIDPPLSGGTNNRTIMSFGANLPETTAFNVGGYVFKHRNFLGADAGCCDIYGQTVHGKDSIWCMVNRNDQRFASGNEAGIAAFNAAKEGLWVIKRNGSSNSFDTLQHYTLDSTWDSYLPHDTTPISTLNHIVGSAGLSFRPIAMRS